MSLAQCLAILGARWRAVLAIFALAVGSTLAVSLMLPRQYTATATVMIDFKPDPVASMMYAGMAPPGFMATQVDVIQSDRVARRVVQNLRLAQNPQVRQQWQDETGGAGRIETWLATAFQKQLEVRPSRDSGVISVSYRAPDPQFAAGVANAFVQAYLETSLALRVDPARQFASFFDSRAKEAREALERAQSRVSAFQKDNGIIASDERLDVENARLNELSSQAVMLQALASESRSRQAQAAGPSADRLQEVLGNPLVGALRADLARSEVRLQELGARLGESHPQVRETQANIASLRARIEAETQRVTSGVGVSNTIARQRQADVLGALESQRAKVLEMKAVRDAGAVLMRDVESAQRAFDAVVARFNQSTLESQATQSNITLLNEAEPPLESSSPRVLLNTLVAVLLGALLAGGGVLLFELANRRVRIAEDISGALSLPVLGSLMPVARRRWFGLRRATLAQQRLVGARRGGAVRGAVAAPPPDAQLELATDIARGSAVLDRSIGDIIAEQCKLSPAQVQQIVQHQQREGVRFGEAAIQLGLASTDDVLVALSQQYHYPYATDDQRSASPELVMLNRPFSAEAEAFRAIRSQVMKRVFNDGTAPRRALAVVSPNAGDGKTYFAANLAVALAQLGGRTLLIDADLRGPRQHEVFNLANPAGLANVLAGRAESQVVQAVPGVPGLFLLPVGNSPPNPLELVERPAFGLLMRELTTKFDHVIVDTPAAEYGADATVIAERCGASLMLARGGATAIAAVEELALELADGPSRLSGVVLNGYRT
jgi:chain length determinant protein tyrosine kinase EpsG